MARRLTRVARTAGAVVVAMLLLAGGRDPGAADAEAARPAHPLAMTGINLAGGEFGGEGRTLVAGRDYVYPDAAVAAPFVAMGMNTARVPVRWENVQHTPLARLDAAEMARIDAAIAALTGFRWVVLDIHNYARFEGRRLSGDARSAALLADLWRRLALRYRDDPRIVFGLMNEPVEIAAADWRRIAEAAVAAIRGTGARNLVLVPGTNWTGAHSWGAGSASNAAVMAGFRDPAHRFAFELHQYLDTDSSGTHPDCVAPGEAVARLRAASAWLEAQHVRGFLGEFGGGPDARCLAALAAVLDHLDRHGDAWLGWTAWAGGAWWGDNPFSLQPADGRAKPQIAVLRRHLAAARATDPKQDTARRTAGQAPGAGG